VSIKSTFSTKLKEVNVMYKVAYYKGEEIAREEAIEPYVDGKFNVDELSSFTAG
jgi:hypothetical protein